MRLALVAGLALGLAGVATADDEAQVRALRARALAHQGDCSGAAVLLEQPGVAASAAAWLEVGKCRVAARDYNGSRGVE